MRKLCFSVMGVLCMAAAFGQPAKDTQVKPGTFIVHFGFQDFTTPQRIKSSSMGSVTGNNKWAKMSEQSPALGISYIQGISNYFDVSANYFLASVNYPFRDDTRQYKTDYLLHELDASIHMKLVPDNHVFVPYLSAGIGASAYYGGRFDAFMPLGAGVQLKLGGGTFIFSNFQYRVPVTERASSHFLSSIGIGTSVGKSRK